MAEFPSNSKENQSKKQSVPAQSKEKKAVQKVTTDQVVQKPKSLASKFKTVFIRGELKSASSYIIYDVLAPQLRNLAMDLIAQSAQRVIFGEGNPRRNIWGGPSSGTRVSYSSMSQQQRNYRGPMQNEPAGNRGLSLTRRQSTDDILLVSKNDADMVLERLGDRISEYGEVSKAELYELVGLPSNFVDDSWGWTSVAAARIQPVREGYLIDMPPTEPLRTM